MLLVIININFNYCHIALYKSNYIVLLLLHTVSTLIDGVIGDINMAELFSNI